MLQQLNRRVSTGALTWAFPVAFVIHDFGEELPAMERFVRDNPQLLAKLPARMVRLLDLTTAQTAVAMACELGLTGLAAYLATRPAKARRALYNVALAVFFLHAFTHVGQAVLLRKYVPGVVTAVLVALPYSLYAYHRLSREGLLREDEIRPALLSGALLAVPVVLAARAVSKALVR